MFTASKSPIPNPLFINSLLRLCFSTPQTTATAHRRRHDGSSVLPRLSPLLCLTPFALNNTPVRQTSNRSLVR
nr:hypothetical protein Iba_scaffold1676052CG0010 [Ipomoea batatas]